VKAGPDACGYRGECGHDEFKEYARHIGGKSMICGCKVSCRKRKCGCSRNTQRCGSGCHGGVAKCDNPYGCEAEISYI
jgi:hypothetical protein